MRTDLHLTFPGNCREAFEFYETTFDAKIRMMMTYGDAPTGTPVPPHFGDGVMHTSLPLGQMELMGCDAPADRRRTLGGFQVSVTSTEEAEVRKWFDALSQGGTVQMPLRSTFWSPLFGMCTDRFGVSWMLGIPGQASN